MYCSFFFTTARLRHDCLKVHHGFRTQKSTIAAFELVNQVWTRQSLRQSLRPDSRGLNLQPRQPAIPDVTICTREVPVTWLTDRIRALGALGSMRRHPNRLKCGFALLIARTINDKIRAFMPRPGPQIQLFSAWCQPGLYATWLVQNAHLSSHSRPTAPWAAAGLPVESCQMF
jgi:hypothetical protein